MLAGVVTTIQEPTSSILELVKRLDQHNGKLFVAGDTKGPPTFENPTGISWPVSFSSYDDQLETGFKLASALPSRHYARKNLGYLLAIREGARCIYETDDDNTPMASWTPREEWVDDLHVVERSPSQWVNIYRHFSDALIWPRGLPLDEIRQETISGMPTQSSRRAPVQQGLVNGSPDVDAIWRLALDQTFQFEEKKSVYLEPGNWCPFNTQTTWWWPLAYPLLYVPSYCSFRMCDIWKSFVAQRCLWALDLGILFHAPEVFQDRNSHDLNRDFNDEIPGYQKNREIAEILANTELTSGEEAVSKNLLTCYQSLVEHEIFPTEELSLVDDWISDLE